MRAPTLALICVAPLIVACIGGDRTPTSVDRTDLSYATTIASVVISPDSVRRSPRDTVRFTATALDRYGRVVQQPATWAVNDTSVVRINTSGLARMIAPGKATVQATIGRTHGYASVTVVAALVTASSIRPSPGSASVVQGATVQLSAVALDASGAIIADALLTWSTTLSTVATVTSTGLVTGVGVGSVSIRIQSGTAFVDVPVSVTLAPAPAPATVASVAISPATATLTVGQSTTLTAVARDVAGGIVTGRSVSWSTSAPLVASVSTSGVVAGLVPGTATISAVVDGVQGTAAVSVGSVVIVPGSGLFPNEPAGFTKWTERDFSAKNQDGWSPIEQNYSLLQVVQDDAAPRSGSLVMQQTYPAGWPSGSSPGIATRLFTTPATQLYISLWVKLSANWFGQESGTNKMFYVWIAGKPKFYISAEGIGTGPLLAQISLQNLLSTRKKLVANVTRGAQVERGGWHRWELVLRSNTPGQANGEAHWWIDGVKVTEYLDVPYTDPGESANWDQFQWSPIWGGVGAPLTAEQTLRFDHIYISVKP